MKYPDIDPISLLKESGCADNIINHCIAVCNLAMVFAKNSPADPELVRAGALLHDIGRCRTHTLAHAQAGAEICRNYGLPEEICLIVERHIGAGLPADECAKEGLKPIDCIPQSIEEKIVAHADNLIAGTEEITLDERLRRSSNLSEKAKKRTIDLAAEIEVYRQPK